jgi:hypothetical protein
MAGKGLKVSGLKVEGLGMRGQTYEAQVFQFKKHLFEIPLSALNKLPSQPSNQKPLRPCPT